MCLTVLLRRSSWYRALSEPAASKRPLVYTTVMTTIERLVEKGLLVRSEGRKGIGGSYTYTATMDERDFVIRPVHEMLDCVARDYPSAITNYLDTRR